MMPNLFSSEDVAMEHTGMVHGPVLVILSMSCHLGHDKVRDSHIRAAFDHFCLACLMSMVK